MSENIPESIPTSADPRSARPLKKRAINTPRDKQAAEVEALFAKPDREIRIPGTGPKRGVAAPPEIVANVQGSSAGAGSGEFHVYKASRRREYERLRLMDEEVKQEHDEKAFLERKAQQEKEDREKTEKNRIKREKARARMERAKMGKKGKKVEVGGDKEGTPAPANGQSKKKLAPNPASLNAEKKDNEEVPDGGEVQNTEETGLVIVDDD